MSTQGEITIRRMAFAFPAEVDPVVVEGHPEESYVYVAFSLLLPHLEPYLIRTMVEARKRVTDPALAADLDLFNGQEGQHYRQHIRFNESIRLQGFAGLEALEAELAADYRRYTETRSLRWNLAYAEGFEAFTTALACVALEEKLTERMHPAAREIYEWHLVEELEHRTVAFDVYEHVCGGYLYRLGVGVFAQWHLNRFMVRGALCMLRADPEAFRARYGGRGAAWERLRPLLELHLRRLWPRVLSTYRPSYTPHRIAMPAGAKEMAARYSAAARSSARAR
jgi:predicted metal-dependent hydrolase